MTNEEYIRALPLEEFAKALIKEASEEQYDYDWDESSYYAGTDNYYVASDGEYFDQRYVNAYEDAIAYEIEWLKQKRE